jgi:broad specificity phosphatase PhoE
MTPHLKLLCHASTHAVRKGAFPLDEPLDAQGRRKLATLSSRLGYADLSLTSPALRAIQTAESLGLNAVVEPLLRDCDYGRWVGRSFEEVQRDEPAAIAAWLQDPAATPHGGESVVALIERMTAWLAAQSAPGVTIAITHAAIIRAALVVALQAEPRSFWRLDVGPLTLARLSGAQGRWNLASLGALDADAGRV